jgi:hypothetical protein
VLLVWGSRELQTDVWDGLYAHQAVFVVLPAENHCAVASCNASGVNDLNGEDLAQRNPILCPGNHKLGNIARRGSSSVCSFARQFWLVQLIFRLATVRLAKRSWFESRYGQDFSLRFAHTGFGAHPPTSSFCAGV